MRAEVSVVIPVFQRQDAGVAALRSVLAQQGVDFEVIVVDDGSPDPFVLPDDVARDARVSLVRQPNAGAAAARNRGVRETQAPWIAFLDSDDLWTEGKLAPQFAMAREVAVGNPLLAVMTGFSQIELATGSRLDRIPVESDDPADFASGCWFGPGSTALVPRLAFEQVGEFDPTLERLEDLDWFLRLALAGGGIRVWPQIGARVNVGGRPSPERLDSAVAKLRAKWLGQAGNTRLPPLIRRNLEAYLAIEQASVRYFSGRPIGFALSLLRSWLARPRLRLHLRNWWRVPDPS